MKKALVVLFNIMTFVGVLSVTLAFFGFGRSFFHKYEAWLLAFLWGGLIGGALLKRHHKKLDAR